MSNTDLAMQEKVDLDNVIRELSIIEKDILDTILDLEEALSSGSQHHIIQQNMLEQKKRMERRIEAITYAKGVLLGWYKP